MEPTTDDHTYNVGILIPGCIIYSTTRGGGGDGDGPDGGALRRFSYLYVA